MKLFYKTLAVTAMSLAFQAHADVTVHLHRDLAPVVVDGEEVGFSFGSKSPLVLNNGKNQIVVRVSKLVEKQGEHEKYNSEAMVVTFDATDAEFTLKPSQLVTRVDQVDAFDSNPSVVVVDSSIASLQLQQDILKRGSGISRDYEKELDRYNRKNNIMLASTPTSTLKAAPVASEEAKSSSEPKSSKSETLSPLVRIKADFNHLNEQQRKEFLMWAVSQ